MSDDTKRSILHPLDPPEWSARERRMFPVKPAAAKPADTDDFPILNPRLFRTRDGQVWLERMTALLFEHSYGPEASEARLRHIEAQRDLIRGIRRHIREAEAKEAKGS